MLHFTSQTCKNNGIQEWHLFQATRARIVTVQWEYATCLACSCLAGRRPARLIIQALSGLITFLAIHNPEIDVMLFLSQLTLQKYEIRNQQNNRKSSFKPLSESLRQTASQREKGSSIKATSASLFRQFQQSKCLT